MGRAKNSRNLTDGDKSTIVEQHKRGSTTAEIGRTIGRNANVVLGYLQRTGLWIRERKATRVSTSKSRGEHLTVAQRKRFARMVSDGVPYHLIASYYGFRSGNDARLYAKELGILPNRLPRQDKTGSTRRCSRCKQEKDLSQFAKQVDKHGNYLCHPCHRRVMVKYFYGISADQYDSMVAKQHGRCAICRRKPWDRATKDSARRKNLAIDHDHATGVIRGLLCTSCNKGLGLLREDPALMRAAVQYLQKHSASSRHRRSVSG